jgi:D-sedoheptulose 7-phosphate isomerase
VEFRWVEYELTETELANSELTELKMNCPQTDSIVVKLVARVEERLLERNLLCEQFFSREALRLAEAWREMAERFLCGGRLLTFGRGPYTTDAQHVSVEFVHPVLVGKRALPALDLSVLFRPWVEAILRPEDIVMGFGPPEGDPEVWATIQEAQRKGAMTFALPGVAGSYAVETGTQDPFMHQEMTEILYHTCGRRCMYFLNTVNSVTM